MNSRLALLTDIRQIQIWRQDMVCNLFVWQFWVLRSRSFRMAFFHTRIHRAWCLDSTNRLLRCILHPCISRVLLFVKNSTIDAEACLPTHIIPCAWIRSKDTFVMQIRSNVKVCNVHMPHIIKENILRLDIPRKMQGRSWRTTVTSSKHYLPVNDVVAV